MSIKINNGMLDTIVDDASEKWDDNPITFSIGVDPGNLNGMDLVGFGGNIEIGKMIEIAELWDDLISGSIEYIFNNDDEDIIVNKVAALPPNFGGVTFSTLHVSLSPDDADIFLRNAPIVAGTATWRTAVHEFGHALGLQHPGDYDASEGSITYANNADFSEDTGQFSIMSYFDPANFGSGWTSANSWSQSQILTPMIYDILAIQQYYGVDTTTRTGNTTYGFNSNADRSVYHFQALQKPVLTIWDAGGEFDRIDVSGFQSSPGVAFTGSQLIDLNEGSYSDVAGYQRNIGIAFGTWIEQAIGGAGNDTLIGNHLNNFLGGWSGNDTLYGGAGNDTLYGDSGIDTLDGGDGDDLLFGNTDNPNVINTLGIDNNTDYLYGGAGNDTAYGGNGDDFLGGWSGNDTLYGEAGNDTLYGDSGIDILDGGDGDDLLFGHTDNQSVIDILGIDNNTDYLYGGAGNDTAYGGNGDDILYGEAGNDTLYGEAGNDSLYGGNGNDYIDGGSGNDYMEGGRGNDTYIVDNFSDEVVENPSVSGGGLVIVSEIDTVQSSISYTLTNNVENLTLLGIANLNGTGNDSYNLLQGNAGENFLFGLGGDDTLYGYAGNDSLYGDAGNDTLYGGSGNDYIDGGSGNDYMVGGRGDDTYVVNSVDDQVVELPLAIIGSGIDTVQSSIDYTLPLFVENLIFVGNFNINGIGDALNNRLQGNSGNNILSGLGGDDSLIGGLGNDALRGGEGNDQLDGGDGDDWLNGEAGNDIIDGGDGYDVFAVFGDFNYTLTNTQFIGEGTDTLVNIEEANLFGGSSNNIFDTTEFTGNVILYGGAGDDLLFAGSGEDLLYGEEGADTLTGGAGNDYLFGGEEDDSLIGGLGNDALRGGEGNDYLFGGDGDDGLNGEAGNDIIDGGDGYDVLAVFGDFNYTLTNTQFIGEGTDTLVNIEGTNLFGGSSNNIFDTTEFTGNVILYGGAGDDLLFAGSGEDLLYGEEGADTLFGGAGNDYLFGGDGSDLFRFATLTEGIDLITDFVFGVDKIGIDAAGFGGELVAGMLFNSQFVLGTTALNETDRFIYDQGTGALFFDQDGTGATAQVQFATLSNFSALSASNIFVV
jgi:Ca2+-binding RTX toxin-like protein